MVNAQQKNGDHFSMRNRSAIGETPSNGEFEAHFVLLQENLQFCVVPHTHPTGFALQNVSAPHTQ